MDGVGVPLAWQVIMILSPTFTFVCVFVDMVGGTKKGGKYKLQICDFLNVE